MTTLTTWRLSTVLEGASATGISLWTFWNYLYLQARSVLYSYGNPVEISLSSCGYISTDFTITIAEEIQGKKELKNLLK